MNTQAPISVFSESTKRGHEQVAFFNFPHVGLKAIVAVHNTVLGPALGGCRMRLYENESQALDDVLRLSEGMTYKSSLAGLDLGGGKACVIADPQMKEGRRELFEQLAHCMNRLGGTYITAEDMGTSVDDIMVMRSITKFAAGFSAEQGGSGDPSPWTARGVYQGILAAAERRYGSKDLKGKTISLQGVGHVGWFLLEHLTKAGAKITATDTNEVRLRKAKEEFGIEICSTDQIYDVPVQIYSPNAIGQTVNHNTLGRLKCDIIAGGANNQLIDSTVYSIIEEKKITYVPDFAINAGGVTSVAAEYIEGGYNRSWIEKKVDAIYNTIHNVLEQSAKRKKFPEVVAIELAKERVAKVAESKGARR